MAYAEKLRRVRADINAAVDLENRLGGKPQQPKSAADPTPLPELLTRSVDACRAERKRKRDADGHGGDGRSRVSDEELVSLARHAQNYALAPYRKFLHYVPRLVNVVSVAEAVPAEGSGVTLPLDVRLIASRCRGAFYAPSRFAAVQLAFSQPRSRILIFHTGHFVGTGANSDSNIARASLTSVRPQVPPARSPRAPPSSARSASSRSRRASTSRSRASRSRTRSAPSRSAPPSTATALPAPTAPTPTLTPTPLSASRGVRHVKASAAVRLLCPAQLPAQN